MKRLICAVLLSALLLSGCTAAGNTVPEKKQYNATFLTLFDTVTTIVGKAESEEAFRQMAQQVHDELLVYHQLFDIYNDYEGVNNLKTINDNAGIAPVTVDRKVIDLLLDCKEFYSVTAGKVNVAMGSLLHLWHVARNDSIHNPAKAYLPDQTALEKTLFHCNINDLIIDEAASTVYLSDPEMRLDVGAIAKGWAVEQVTKTAPSGLLISVGGNVRATGPKEEGTPWVVGIQDPRQADQYLHTLYLTQGSLVTSGDYQRTYMVDGEAYHHIIDPLTLYPSQYWSSVTIVCTDSGLADALSTALFLMDQQSGQALLDQFDAEALWVDREGNLYYSPGFEEFIRT